MAEANAPAWVPTRLTFSLGMEAAEEAAGLLPRSEATEDDWRLQLVSRGRFDHVGWDGSLCVSRGPRDFCVDRRGRVFILGTDGDAVYLLNADGQLAGTLQETNGPQDMQFTCLDVDGCGRAYCYDAHAQQVVAFGVRGEMLSSIRVEPTEPKSVDLVVSPEGRVFGVEEDAYFEFQDGALARVSFQWPSRPDRARALPWVLAEDACLYLHSTPGQDTFYQLTTDMQLTRVFRRPSAEGNDFGLYSQAGDAWGFLYGHCLLLSAEETKGQAEQREGECAAGHDLLLGRVSAYAPRTTRFFSFLVRRGFWAVERLGHDGAYYTLTHNSLPWGGWNGLRIYRHDLTEARANAKGVAVE